MARLSDSALFTETIRRQAEALYDELNAESVLTGSVVLDVRYALDLLALFQALVSFVFLPSA